MIPGSTQTLHRARYVGIVALIVLPLAVIAGGWWALERFVLSPAVPGASADAETCAAFMAHAKGLPRLDRAAREAFVDGQFNRLAASPEYGRQLAAAIRRSTPEEQEAIRGHLFDVFKPRILDEARAYFALPPDRRSDYLDARLVDFKKSERTLKALHLSKGSMGSAMMDQAGALRMIQSKISDEERTIGVNYFKEMAARAEEILLDDELKAEFERKLGFTLP